MFIAYYDESGDDGFPQYSSPIFVLTSLYIHHADWKETYQEIYKFRKWVKEYFELPIKVELHTKDFLLNKNPYRKFKISDETRIFIIDQFCDLIAQLDLKIINVVINKKAISLSNYMFLIRHYRSSHK